MPKIIHKNCWCKPCRGSRKLPHRTKWIDPDGQFDAFEYVNVLNTKRLKLVKSLARWVKDENVQAGDKFPDFALNVHSQIKDLQKQISVVKTEYPEAFDE